MSTFRGTGLGNHAANAEMRSAGAATGTSEGIHAVAARIQDRIVQLQSERRVLELVKAEQDEQQMALDEEMEASGLVRQDYLTAMRARHGVELELLKIEDKKKECEKSLENLQQKAQDLQTQKEEVQSSWDDMVTNVFADHHLKREIYRSSIQSQIEQREGLISSRTAQLATLAKGVESFRKSMEEVKEEKIRLENEIEELEQAAETEDDEVHSVANKVRDMVAKVKITRLLFGLKN